MTWCLLMQEFEAKGLGSFGGGPESRQAWRNRVESQDAYSAAAAAKAAATQAREQAVLTKRALLAQLEAAIPAVPGEEAAASAAAAAAQEALQDVESHAQASLPSRFWALTLALGSVTPDCIKMLPFS